MQWNSVQEFLHMGGYGFYVWTSFGLTAAVVVAEVLQVRQHRRRVLEDVRASFESEEESKV